MIYIMAATTNAIHSVWKKKMLLWLAEIPFDLQVDYSSMNESIIML